MQRFMRIATRAVAAAFIAAGIVAHPAAQSPATGIERLAWLQGCWETAPAEDRSVEEHWMAPRGGTMIGTSRTVRGGATVEYEFVMIRERGEQLVYVAHPSGQPSAEFVAATVTDGRVVFENPAHDFPQRIGYARNGTSLNAWIEGTRNGQSRKVPFPYRRVSCPAD